jgi:hypothetical protein
LKPPSAFIVTLNFADCPGVKVPQLGVVVSEKSIPVPASATWLVPSVSTMVTAPLRAPPCVGLKITVMVQEAPAFTVLPQLFVSLKSPPALIAEICRAAVPLLASLMVCADEAVPTGSAPNCNPVGASKTEGDGVPPVPDNGTICGLPEASSATESAPTRFPLCVGVKTTLIAQLAPGARLVPQEFVSLKSPVTANPEMLSVEVPVFVSMTLCADADDPTRVLANVKLIGFNDANGAIPVPVRLTVCGLPLASSDTDSVPVRAPPCVGVNVTETVQFAPAASVAPQVLDCAKSPDAEIPEIFIVDVPLLLNCTWCALLVDPTT